MPETARRTTAADLLVHGTYMLRRAHYVTRPRFQRDPREANSSRRMRSAAAAIPAATSAVTGPGSKLRP